eukprot:scaffold1534_cov391-Prasinococcus_capsulatus_cf.AAC.10
MQLEFVARTDYLSTSTAVSASIHCSRLAVPTPSISMVKPGQAVGTIAALTRSRTGVGLVQRITARYHSQWSLPAKRHLDEFVSQRATSVHRHEQRLRMSLNLATQAKRKPSQTARK